MNQPAKKSIVAAAIIIIIAFVLVIISLVVLSRSDTKENFVIPEQAANTAVDPDLAEVPDDISPLSADALDVIETGIIKTAASVNASELGSTELTDTSLGL